MAPRRSDMMGQRNVPLVHARAQKVRVRRIRRYRGTGADSSTHQRSPRGRRLWAMPLLLQFLGVLHLSAVCTRAITIAGSTATCTSPAAIAASPTSLSSHKKVESRLTSKQPRQVKVHRRPGLSSSFSSSSRAPPAAFAPPMVRTPVHRRDHPRNRCGSRASTSPLRFDQRESPLAAHYRRGILVRMMTAPTAAAEAAVAVLAAAAAVAAGAAGASRLAIPAGNQGSDATYRNRRASYTASERGRGVSSSAGSSPGSGSSSSSSSSSGSLFWVHHIIFSFLRWLLTAGKGINRRPRVVPRRPSLKRSGSGVGGGSRFLSWRWPFASNVDSASSAATQKDGKIKEGGPGSSSSSSSSKASGSAMSLSAVQQVQNRYPRPQSTRYPRPQSTAYPRPKVDASTLLGVDPEESAQVLAYGKKPMALLKSPARAKDPKRSSGNVSSDFLCWLFARIITKRAQLVEGLEIKVDARSNREAMSGLLQEVCITFNHLELENLRISGGAVMTIRGLDLKVMTLLWRRFRSFKKPFEVSGSYVFTSEDLASSPMVRRLVNNMMNATLRKLETYATNPRSLKKSLITISEVTAKRSRLVIDGDMYYDNVRVPFTYRTSIGVKGNGHIVYLKDSEMFWENVGGSLSLPLVPLQTFDVDIGDGARIESIRIVDGRVAAKARFVLSPFPPLVVASMFKRAALRYDVGEKLSVIFDNLIQNMRIL